MVLVTCSQTSLMQIDMTELRGLYVVAYTTDSDIRNRMEDQLVIDLMEQDITAMASYIDIRAITRTTPRRLINEALERKALGIIIIKQVAGDGSDASNQNPDRISPVHPTVQEFYADSRDLVGESYTEEREAFVEVNLFLIDSSGGTILFWSGTTWSFNADNEGGAIQEISSIIAQQLSVARDQLL